jgi:hypothetical protein
MRHDRLIKFFILLRDGLPVQAKFSLFICYVHRIKNKILFIKVELSLMNMAKHISEAF